jgi:hypothetical protein
MDAIAAATATPVRAGGARSSVTRVAKQRGAPQTLTSARKRSLHRCVLIALALLPAAAPWAGGSDATRVVIPYRAFPGDSIFVPAEGGGICNQASLDPARPPQVRRTQFHDSPDGPSHDSYRYALTYWLRNDEAPICGVPPPAPEFFVDVGVLPLGTHFFSVTGNLEGAVMVTYETTSAWVWGHDFLPPDVSGLWSDPTQSGRGLSVIPIAYDNFALFWATHDGQGSPLWVVSSGPPLGNSVIGGNAVFTRGPPLASGPSVSPPQPWGSIKFNYFGCGRAQFTWTPLDPATPPGTQMLVKLAQSFYETRCAPAAQAQAIWID